MAERPCSRGRPHGRAGQVFVPRRAPLDGDSLRPLPARLGAPPGGGAAGLGARPVRRVLRRRPG
eukprot:1657902-Lingulodinium_polyedra.AAC.1